MQRTFERPEEAPIIYVGLPADYTGDIWHVICAMKAFSSLHVVITQTAATSYAKAVSQVEKQEKNAGLLKKQLVDAGIVQQRIEVITQKSEERVSETVIWDGNPMGILGLPGKADMWRSMALVQMAHPSAPVIPLYQTTRLFLAHCAHEARVGGGSVFEKLTIFLTDGLSGDEKASVLAAVEAHLNALPLDSNIMYVFCRNAGYNLQHNMTPDRWGKIVAGVQQAKTWVVCGVGNKQDELIKSILSPEQQEQMLDFYAQPTKLDGETHLSANCRAYFWSSLKEKVHDRGFDIALIGGRSGSVDVAAFVGVRTLCWDQCEPFNPEYIRLFSQTNDLNMSIVHVFPDQNASLYHVGPNDALLKREGEKKKHDYDLEMPHGVSCLTNIRQQDCALVLGATVRLSNTRRGIAAPLTRTILSEESITAFTDNKYTSSQAFGVVEEIQPPPSPSSARQSVTPKAKERSESPEKSSFFSKEKPTSYGQEIKDDDLGVIAPSDDSKPYLDLLSLFRPEESSPLVPPLSLMTPIKPVIGSMDNSTPLSIEQSAQPSSRFIVTRQDEVEWVSSSSRSTPFQLLSSFEKKSKPAEPVLPNNAQDEPSMSTLASVTSPPARAWRTSSPSLEMAPRNVHSGFFKPVLDAEKTRSLTPSTFESSFYGASPSERTPTSTSSRKTPVTPLSPECLIDKALRDATRVCGYDVAPLRPMFSQRLKPNAILDVFEGVVNPPR